MQKKSERTDDLDYTVPEISLFTILNGGNGIVSDLVAKWIAASDMKPSSLFTTETGQEATEQYSPNSSMAYLEVLRKHFPYSLKSANLLCHLAWEYANAWNKDVRELKYLEIALEYIQLFDKNDFAIKHGVCAIIWNEILRKFVKIAIKIVNQIGNPNDESKPHETFTDIMVSKQNCFEFCKKYIQFIIFPNFQIPDFVGCCNRFLDHLIDSRNSPKDTPMFEVILQDGAKPALVTRAIQYNQANSDIIELHFQLNEAILIITSLNVTVKNSMSSLFNDASKELFACDICMVLALPIPRPDDIVNKLRKHFLHRTINATVDLIRKDYQEVYLADFVVWTERLMSLGKRWTLNLDDLQKYQIIQLYTRGWDEFAETKLDSLEQPSTMGKTLLSIAGTRLNQYVKDKPDLYSRVLATGSRVSAYLEKLVRKNI